MQRGLRRATSLGMAINIAISSIGLPFTIRGDSPAHAGLPAAVAGCHCSLERILSGNCCCKRAVAVGSCCGKKEAAATKPVRSCCAARKQKSVATTTTPQQPAAEKSGCRCQTDDESTALLVCAAPRILPLTLPNPTALPSLDTRREVSVTGSSDLPRPPSPPPRLAA